MFVRSEVNRETILDISPHFTLTTHDYETASTIAMWDYPALGHVSYSNKRLYYRLFRINELIADKSFANRFHMGDVIATTARQGVSLIYVVEGTDKGVGFFLGVASEDYNTMVEASVCLKNSFEGHLMGATLSEVEDRVLEETISPMKHLGCIGGIPSFNEEEKNLEESDFRGIERLVNSMAGERWRIVIVAEPGSEDTIMQTIKDINDLATTLSANLKHSVQTSSSLNRQVTKNISESTSQTMGKTITDGKTDSQTTSLSTSSTSGHSQTTSTTSSRSSSVQKTASESFSKGFTNSKSNSTTYGKQQSVSESKSSTTSSSKGWSEGKSESITEGVTYGSSETITRSESIGKTATESESRSDSKGYSESRTTGESISYSHSTSSSSSTSLSDTRGKTFSYGETIGEGSGISLSREHINKHCEHILKHLQETLLPRFQLGYAKGMFRTAIYLTADTAGVYERLVLNFRSIFQGNKASMTPLRSFPLPEGERPPSVLLQTHCLKHPVSFEQILIHSISPGLDSKPHNATWLNSEELSLIMGLPARELPGVSIVKPVEFSVNPPQPKSIEEAIVIGHVIHHGRKLPFKPLALPRSELNKHVFITGVTGAGKTTTCIKLLLESNLPFWVIEPAKTEYRILASRRKDILFFSLGREDLSPFRLNPFELVSPEESLTSHIDIIKNTLCAVFPMEAAMPYIIEEAIIKAYESRGWVIHQNFNLLYDDPFSSRGAAWPNFSDVIRELDVVIRSKGMGREFEEKYRGSLVARLTNLTHGTKGKMLNCRLSLDFDRLLDKRVVIELEEVKDEGDKALIMGLILARLAESVKQRHKKQPWWRHITLVEEAHRLLSKPSPGDGGSLKLGVDMFCNLLAEVRKYGEGLIIADQIPEKLVPDVIKNTNIKIVHRLFSADDRNAIGDSMCLTDEQKEHLPVLKPGQAVVYAGGWHAPVLVQVIKPEADTSASALDDEEFRKIGLEIRWEQRNRLFPKLSELNLFKDARSFYCFQTEASAFCAILKNFALSYYERRVKKAKDESRFRLFQDVLVKRAKELAGRWSETMGVENLRKAIMAQFQDEFFLDLPSEEIEAVGELFDWILGSESSSTPEFKLCHYIFNWFRDNPGE